MLTKTLKFDDDVLGVLRGMEWNEDGTLGIITGGQLERPLYVSTNKALESMGGKWNRKAGGHIFKVDPRPSVEGLLESGVLEVERDGFFETPASVVDRMLELAWPNGRILEPSAGLGAIADRLPVSRDTITCIEKNQARADELIKKGYSTFCDDFLQRTGLVADTIYMNPPFEQGQDIDHVQHAYKLLAHVGTLVSVMSEGPFFRGDSKAKAFREWFQEIGGYSEVLPPGSFQESGTGVNARLVVLQAA